MAAGARDGDASDARPEQCRLHGRQTIWPDDAGDQFHVTLESRGRVWSCSARPTASSAAPSLWSVHEDRVDADRTLALLERPVVVVEDWLIDPVVAHLGTHDEVLAELPRGRDRELVRAYLAETQARPAVVLERLEAETERERTRWRRDRRVARHSRPDGVIVGLHEAGALLDPVVGVERERQHVRDL